MCAAGGYYTAQRSLDDLHRRNTIAYTRMLLQAYRGKLGIADAFHLYTLDTALHTFSVGEYMRYKYGFL